MTGRVFVNTQLTPMGEIMPFVEQGGYQPRRYLGLGRRTAAHRRLLERPGL